MFKSKKTAPLLKVITFGTFDLLHPGHLSYLTQARALGNHLTIIVARDKTVNSVKGKMPQEKEETRLLNLKKCKIGDEVFLGNLQNPLQVITQHNPNIIALGYDQTTFITELENFLKTHPQPIKIVRLKSYYPEKYKSSLIKKTQ